MEPPSDILLGFLYSLLWVGAIVASQSSLFYLALATIFGHPPLYRKISDLFLTGVYIHSRFLSYLCGMRITASGDRLISTESAILIGNHRTRTDWNFICSLQPQNVIRFKGVSKQVIQHIPFFGWFLQMSGIFFLSRRWKKDKSHLEIYLTHLVSTLRNKIHFLIFCEGSTFNNLSKAESDRYAEVQGLPKYNHVLHPRTTGFTFLVDFLRKKNSLDAIYDITVAFPDKLPFSETDILRGKLPKEVHIHIQRIPESELPCDKDELENWLKRRWSEKEERLKKFVETKKFSDESWPEPERWTLLVTAALYFIVECCTYGLIIYWPFFRRVTILQGMFFVGLSFSKFNFTDLEIAYYAFWNQHLKNRIPFMNWLDWLCDQL